MGIRVLEEEGDLARTKSPHFYLKVRVHFNLKNSLF